MDAIESRGVWVSASLPAGKGFASNKGTRGAECVRVPARLDLVVELRGDVGVKGSGLELRGFSRPEADCVRFVLEPCGLAAGRVTSSMITPCIQFDGPTKTLSPHRSPVGQLGRCTPGQILPVVGISQLLWELCCTMLCSMEHQHYLEGI